MLDVLDELLVNLKSALFDPMLPQPEDREILALERFTLSIRVAEGASLVEEYRGWRSKWPCTTAAMIWTARTREQAERLALAQFLNELEPRGGADI